MNFVTPIKTQGKKTKLINLIREHSNIENKTYVEPFLGSGEVLFNLKPKKAYVSDTNTHIISFYKSIQTGQITSLIVRDFLEFHGKYLSTNGKDYYYSMREKFNQNFEPLFFLFLNRSCFNGMIRFNNNGKFNVPFCNKPDRFSKSYITKIVNQVKSVEAILKDKQYNWTFEVSDWKKTLDKFSNENEVFFYFDPPYVNRHATYFNDWSEKTNNLFFNHISKIKGEFLLSNWYQNKYRINEQLQMFFPEESYKYIFVEHFYHLGANLSNRNSMTECLIKNK